MKKAARTTASKKRTYRTGPRDRTVVDEQGHTLSVPPSWRLLPPGDATLTRRVKSATEHYAVTTKKGRRVISMGIWADGEVIDRLDAELHAHRQTDQYKKSLSASRKRAAVKQTEYVGEFRDAILSYLNFAPVHRPLSERLADAVAAHATPVGSGTVARTKRIPVAKRAEAAVIAWLRHQTTAYDHMKIERVKGKRREMRRQLAAGSKRLLQSYRDGKPTDDNCPLAMALREN